MGKINRKELMLDILYDIIGCGIYAFGIHTFTVPNHIAPGGFSGLGTIVNHYTGLPIGTFVLMMNIPILLFAVRFLGRHFIYNTLKSVLISTAMLDFAMAPVPVYVGNPLLAAVFGGVCIGTGLGIVFSRGSTTGGTDVIMRLLRLKFPTMSMGTLMLMLDLLVIASSVVAFGDIEVGLYGIIAIYCSSTSIDRVLFAGDRTKTVLVFSDKHEEIAQKIMEEVNRGVTYLDGEGAYSKQRRKILLCAVRDHEFVQLKKVVNSIDPHAFVIVSDSEKIYGEGFNPHDEI